MTSVRHLHLSLVSSCILEKLVFLDMARNGGYNVVPVETVGRRYQCQICLLISCPTVRVRAPVLQAVHG